MTLPQKTTDRVRRWLDAALCRGAFDVSGGLYGLSADAIADEIATDWDASERGKLAWNAGASTAEAADLEPFVQRWLDRNELA
jgi:hypothetical protein